MLQCGAHPVFGFAHLGFAGDDLFEFGRQQTEHGRLNLFNQLVDDFVGANLDRFTLGHITATAIGTDIESNNRGVRGFGELHVVLGDAAHAAVHDGQLDIVALEFA